MKEEFMDEYSQLLGFGDCTEGRKCHRFMPSKRKSFRKRKNVSRVLTSVNEDNINLL